MAVNPPARDDIVIPLVTEIVAFVGELEIAVTWTEPLNEVKVLPGCSVASVSLKGLLVGVGSSTTVVPVVGLKRSTRRPRASPYTLPVRRSRKPVLHVVGDVVRGIHDLSDADTTSATQGIQGHLGGAEGGDHGRSGGRNEAGMQRLRRREEGRKVGS